MNENEKRPAMPEQSRSDISLNEQHKDTPKLSKRQKKVFELLLAGKHSAADITIRLGYCDPRSYIRELREKGIIVKDEWVQKEEVRYKLYWVEG